MLYVLFTASLFGCCLFLGPGKLLDVSPSPSSPRGLEIGARSRAAADVSAGVVARVKRAAQRQRVTGKGKITGVSMGE